MKNIQGCHRFQCRALVALVLCFTFAFSFSWILLKVGKFFLLPLEIKIFFSYFEK